MAEVFQYRLVAYIEHMNDLGRVLARMGRTAETEKYYRILETHLLQHEAEDLIGKGKTVPQ